MPTPHLPARLAISCIIAAGLLFGVVTEAVVVHLLRPAERGVTVARPVRPDDIQLPPGYTIRISRPGASFRTTKSASAPMAWCTSSSQHGRLISTQNSGNPIRPRKVFDEWSGASLVLPSAFDVREVEQRLGVDLDETVLEQFQGEPVILVE